MEGENKEGKNPLISVVIPCFRAGALLAEAIESVLAQTETDWELILVDNNASEETKEVIAKYTNLFPEKIKSVLETNQGLSFARNRGIKESKGQFIAFLDDDDLMYPQRLSWQKEALEKEPSSILCFGMVDKVNQQNTKILQKNWLNPYFYEKFELPINERNNFIDAFPSTWMMRKFLMISNNLFFDEHLNPFYFEDSDFLYRAFRVGKFVSVQESIIRFRLASPEFLKTKRINNAIYYRTLKNQDYFFSKLINDVKNNNEKKYYNALSKKLRSRWLREASFFFLALGANGKPFARTLLLESIKTRPADLKSLKHYLRSFMSSAYLRKKYTAANVTEDVMCQEITMSFLKSLFLGQHKCEFCKSSRLKH